MLCICTKWYLCLYSSQVFLEESVFQSQKMIATPTNNAPSGPSPSTTPTMSRSVAKTPSTPSTSVSATTSTQSRCDYSCYTLRKTEQGDILAVIIEAKMEESSQQAVAQLMGYVLLLLRMVNALLWLLLLHRPEWNASFFPLRKMENAS